MAQRPLRWNEALETGNGWHRIASRRLRGLDRRNLRLGETCLGLPAVRGAAQRYRAIDEHQALRGSSRLRSVLDEPLGLAVAPQLFVEQAQERAERGRRGVGERGLLHAQLCAAAVPCAAKHELRRCRVERKRHGHAFGEDAHPNEGPAELTALREGAERRREPCEREASGLESVHAVR
jgi:hypothetical protein